MTAAHPQTVQRSRRTRAAISNGSRGFLDADGRSAEARLLRDRERDLAECLGGLEGLSASERIRVSAAAVLSVRLELVRSGLARGDRGVSDEDLSRLTNALGRELGALDRLAAGRRKAKGAAGPDALRRYLAEKAAREGAAA